MTFMMSYNPYTKIYKKLDFEVSSMFTLIAILDEALYFIKSDTVSRISAKGEILKTIPNSNKVGYGMY